jgi:hypothetical protein
LSKESFNSHGPEYARGGVAHKAPTLRRVLHDPFSHRNLADNSPAGPRPGGPLPTKFSDVPNRKRRFVFIADAHGAAELPAWVTTGKQSTDGHLLELAKAHGAELATLDEGIPGAFRIP